MSAYAKKVFALRELIEALEGYPLLLSIVWSTMTDEEFEQYMDSLPDPTDEELGYFDSSGFAGTSSSKGRHSGTKLGACRSQALAEEALIMLRDTVEGEPPSVLRPLCKGSAELINLMTTWSSVTYVKGLAETSPELAQAWNLHVMVNYHLARAEGQTNEDDAQKANDWPSSARLKAQHLLRQNLEVTTVDTLGSRLFSVAFGGPYRSTLVFSSEALDGTEEVERDFMLYHMFAHLLMGHIPYRGFGVRLEHKRGCTPPSHLTSEYTKSEEAADQAASCMLYSEYIAADHLTEISRQAVRGVLQMGIADRPLIRELIRERQRRRDRLIHIIGNALDAIRARDFTRLSSPPLPYHGTFRVVKARDRHMYLVWTQGEEGHWRRWICSSRVLSRLGLTPKDVEPISEEELATYRDTRPLLDPAEVDQVRGILTDSIINNRPGYPHPITPK